jgi:aspartate 1-decarboxylase
MKVGGQMLMKTFLSCKIHNATVTDADVNYCGSISIDKYILAASGIEPYEKVDVLDVTNGERLTTYALPSVNLHEIKVNGAAAKKIHIGDKVIIITYISTDLPEYTPNIIVLHALNKLSGE